MQKMQNIKTSKYTMQNTLEYIKYTIHKMQNIKIHYDGSRQWAYCLMVSIVSEATGFYLLQMHI